MRKFKLTSCGETASAPIDGSKERMEMLRRSRGMVLFRRVSQRPRVGFSLEMEWDVFTIEEIKAIYHLITEEVV